MIKIGNDLPKWVFGCECYMHLYSTQTNKLAPESITCVFVGYSNTHKGYKCYYPSGRKIITSRDVTFNELKRFYLHNHDIDFLPLIDQDSGRSTSSEGMILQDGNIANTTEKDRYILKYAEEPGNNIHTIQNYSKLPLYPQVYSTKGKEKVNESNESNSSINDANLPKIKESIIVDTNNLHPQVIVPDNPKPVDKQTTPYPIRS